MKIAFLTLCRAIGLFRLAAWANRRKLCILCYHGFAINEESVFRPKLFMEPTTFAARMKRLKETGRPVLPLSQAIDLLYSGRLPSGAVVITIDDGFYSVYRSAAPVLKSAGFPATVYVTSYYVQKGTPIYRLYVQFAFWKTSAAHFRSAEVVPDVQGEVDLNNLSERNSIIHRLIEYGESRTSEEQVEICHRLGDHLGVPFHDIVSSRGLSLMTGQEIRALAESDIDVQLHTHRHRLPLDREEALREIGENRAALSSLTRNALNHLCYPSGEWSPLHWPWLSEIGVETATTCDYGLNSFSTNRLALFRFLDGENISTVEFDAAISGFTEWLRAFRDLIRNFSLRLFREKGATSLFFNRWLL